MCTLEMSILKAATLNGLLQDFPPPNKHGSVSYTMMDSSELLQVQIIFQRTRPIVCVSIKVTQKLTSHYKEIQALLYLLQFHISCNFVEAYEISNPVKRHFTDTCADCKPRWWNQERKHHAAWLTNKSGLIIHMPSGKEWQELERGWAMLQNKEILILWCFNSVILNSVMFLKVHQEHV